MAEEEKKKEEKVGEKAEEAIEEVVDEPVEIEKPTEPEVKVAEEPKTEAPTPAAKAEKTPPSGKHADMIKQIESMTVADLSDLVKALEERFGVSAAAPMAVAGAAAAGAGAAPAAEEKSSYTVMLKDGGAQKIAAIKAVREINQDLGLKEAKDLVDGAPKEIKKDMSKGEAEEAKKKLEAAGATVELV
jgi:large subunit ribosomal protein L7/L12